MAGPIQRLPGGFVNEVVRIGDTVRRTRAERADFVHALLRHFEARGWSGAPRFVGVDERGREILTFVEGFVPWRPEDQAPRVRTRAALVALARLVRQFHDLTAGTDLAGGHEVVCHNDLSPKNTVYRDAGTGSLPVAFIDWDIAAPGARIHDVAHLCWQYPDLGHGITDPHLAAALIRVIADGYGLADRSGLIDAVLWWQDRCWRGIAAAAEDGVVAMVRLRDTGAMDQVRAAYRWTAEHRAALERGL
jgi:hypothetical protein